ncbi:hypothetical protein [Actinoplanes aureus]|uniref:hypothetical protein n=1 Tax=Actinoplanes aureus TaxID=2792083 RepID=UPI001E52B579|nr:hypothetical protein [Actinoplanes aureus]
MLGAFVSVALIGTLLAAPARPADAGPACVSVADGEARAVTMAAACRRAVVVAGSRTELTQVVAQPDGRMRFESAVVPQRARTRDGGWADVDLRLACGADGRLRPAAAADPAVRTTRLTVGGGVDLSQRRDGTLRATAGGTSVAEAAPALMWDSRGATGPKTRSSAATTGDGAKVAPVRAEVAGKNLLLRADPKLLDAKDRVFPIFIDPDWSVFKNKWAYATNNGASNDLSSARVGLNPDSGALYRSCFAFPTTANGVFLGGKHIQSARVEMKLDHSWGCSPTPASLYWTSVINAVPKASWSAMGLATHLGEAWGSANEAGGCNPPRPDMYMNFQSANLTALIQQGANDRWGDVTVAVTARDSGHGGESIQARWKRFFPNETKLIVDYDSVPTPPTALQVAGVACPETGVLSVGTLTPTL